MKTITTQNLFIRIALKGDAERLARYEKRNKEHWQLYASTLISDPTQANYWADKLADLSLDKSQIRFLIFKTEDQNQIVGTCNYTQIFRGPFQACYLGYKIDKDFEGKGFMFEALSATNQYIFEVENLHRIMANYIPSNVRSEKLLTRLGFVKEGLAKEYLLINGNWEDHVLTSLTNPNWKEKVKKSVLG